MLTRLEAWYRGIDWKMKALVAFVTVGITALPAGDDLSKLAYPLWAFTILAVIHIALSFISTLPVFLVFILNITLVLLSLIYYALVLEEPYGSMGAAFAGFSLVLVSLMAVFFAAKLSKGSLALTLAIAYALLHFGALIVMPAVPSIAVPIILLAVGIALRSVMWRDVLRRDKQLFIPTNIRNQKVAESTTALLRALADQEGMSFESPELPLVDGVLSNEAGHRFICGIRTTERIGLMGDSLLATGLNINELVYGVVEESLRHAKSLKLPLEQCSVFIININDGSAESIALKVASKQYKRDQGKLVTMTTPTGLLKSFHEAQTAS